MSPGDNFVTTENNFFYHIHSKTILRNFLRIYNDDNLVIRGNENDDDFT